MKTGYGIRETVFVDGFIFSYTVHRAPYTDKAKNTSK